MKKIVFILLLLSALKLSAQNYDLIVTTEGDSIACKIDSITDSKIYFEMIVKNNWFHTHTTLDKIAEYKYDAIDKLLVIFKSGSSYIEKILTYNKYFDRNIYSNRYLFAPSAFAMQEGLFSYSNITFGLHDFQYGLSDNFSFGFGTTIFFLPIYFMPVYTIPINEKSSFAIGDMLMVSPYSELSFFGNLFYGMYTKRSTENNFSIGLGLWTTTESDVAAKTISPAINFSAMLKTNYKSYFITENYIFQYNINAPVIFDLNSTEEKFLQAKYVLSGISGFRVIGKNFPRNSWQFALAYIFVISEDAPSKYKTSDWIIEAEYNSTQFIPWPIISYTRKF